MDEENLDALEDMIKRVKAYKEAARYVTSEDLEGVEEVEEVENELEGEDRFSDGDIESFEGLDEGTGFSDGGDEQDEGILEAVTENNGDRDEEH